MKHIALLLALCCTLCGLRASAQTTTRWGVMAGVNMKEGIVKLLKKDTMTKGIDVTLTSNNRLVIDFHVIVSYGVNIRTVADNLIESVRYKVEEFTGLEIEKINIYVEGVRLID